jgi:hypothetical protein
LRRLPYLSRLSKSELFRQYNWDLRHKSAINYIRTSSNK